MFVLIWDMRSWSWDMRRGGDAIKLNLKLKLNLNLKLVNIKNGKQINPKKVGDILKVEVEDQLKVEDIEKVESKKPNPKTHFIFRHTTEG
jgi:hypothetical protein